jgi:Zn-dependent protease with chaperone function
MTDEAFEALVSRLEREARRAPVRYRWKVVGLAVLGNAYLAGVVLLLLAVVVAALTSIAVFEALAVKAAILLVVALVPLLRSLWVRLEPPRGVALSRRNSPELFASIDRLRRAMRAPRIHRVLLTDEFNASVMQIPRLGVLGWQRNHLLVGLPLLKAMKVPQFEAVVAHELGHLAHGHGRVANWVYSQRQRWARLMAALEQRGIAARWLFKPFLARFAPYFNAYSFPLARANEYLADAAAARVTSKAAIADALTSVAVVGGFLAERYWRDIVRHADHQPMPSFAPHATMGSTLVRDLDPRSIKQYLQRALAGRTGTADTHPSLHDRLHALGDKARLRLPRDGQGADQLLGAALPGLTAMFDRRWQESVEAAWTERFAAVRAGRECLAELDRRVASGESLERHEAFERAQLTADVGHDEASAIEQLRALVDADPDDATAFYALGTRLLAHDDAEGLLFMEQAMELDEFAIVHALEQQRDFHTRQGNVDAARASAERLHERSNLEGLAHAERSGFAPDDELDEHDLSAEAVQALRLELAGVEGVRSAYVARKRVVHLPHRPCYVLAFTVRPRWMSWRRDHARHVDETMQRLQRTSSLPGDTILLCVEGRHVGLLRRLRVLSNTKVR